jgi:hypothetical protein
MFANSIVINVPVLWVHDYELRTCLCIFMTEWRFIYLYTVLFLFVYCNKYQKYSFQACDYIYVYPVLSLSSYVWIRSIGSS